ncbi:MAG: LLM class flavin-dependent oxidoreductase [Thermoflexus sp.]|uniref:LLM class flavin-dependent oxidoreductase n=1 Tax=Thermoflexus sp. TaxID=1969742 RepID=UPI0025FF0D7D|nr:LLM class flavin-dependent oxidoreductase [Thermoflexus sp.]MCS6965082.1 LLM class flavin-dependent oxidoreductase [Thermoflexus sp.]MDW8185323.1 LLM class flavin-dependent oxidoreductase [Anaerolineae bacterium]
MSHEIWLGLNIDPSVDRREEAFWRARLADTHGLDWITVQDHPYNPNFLETWTLLVALGMATQRVRLGPNVACTPLRSPAMLAKMSATLDVLTGGRVELGVGAGALPEGIYAFGGVAPATPAERVAAFREAVEILRGMWAHSGGTFSYAGRFYRVTGARPGPAPAHPIRLWFGALGPRMLRLTGRMGDGLLVSSPYVPPERLPEVHRRIDEGAAEAGRPPTAIRRGYNLMGVLDLGRPDTQGTSRRPGVIVGPPARWVEEILRLHEELRMDTFIFWPVMGNERIQVEAFAQEVVPMVRERGRGGGRG